MNQLQWEYHLMRRKEMMRKVEATKLRQIAQKAHGNRWRPKLRSLYAILMLKLHNLGDGRYNEPVEPIECAHTVPRLEHR